MEQIHYVPIKCSERMPAQKSMIHFCLIDGRMPIMAQDNPQGWCWLDSIPATREPQVIGGKGVSHWLEPQPIKEPLSFEEYLCKQYPDAFTKENFKSWVIIDDTLHFEYKGYLIGCKSPVSPIDREEAYAIADKVWDDNFQAMNKGDVAPAKIPMLVVDALLSKGLLSNNDNHKTK